MGSASGVTVGLQNREWEERKHLKIEFWSGLVLLFMKNRKWDSRSP